MIQQGVKDGTSEVRQWLPPKTAPREKHRVKPERVSLAFLCIICAAHRSICTKSGSAQ